VLTAVPCLPCCCGRAAVSSTYIGVRRAYIPSYFGSSRAPNDTARISLKPQHSDDQIAVAVGRRVDRMADTAPGKSRITDTTDTDGGRVCARQHNNNNGNGDILHMRSFNGACVPRAH